jgi:hypothetical protein
MRRVWLVLAMVAAPALAHAQIVNVQGALARAPEQDGIGGQVEAKVNWREGNNPLFDIGGAGTLLVRQDRFLGLALARGEYGTARGLTLTRKSFEHLRARVEIDGRWRWEAFAQHEYDQFRRLSLRALAGTGPALQIVARPGATVLAGAAYIIELERLDRRMGTRDAGRRTIAHRASLYVTGHEELSAGVSIVETVYVQPRLDEPSDLRVLGELAALTKLSARVALKNSFTIAYDDTPPDGVKRYDTQLELAVIVTF